ncbi:Dirigent protein [Euphorbia peplus]|nr:Dirigent protein [Euphorbia peplus]
MTMMSSSKKTLVFLFFSIFLAFSSNVQSMKMQTPCKELVVYYHDIIYNGHNSDNTTATLIAAPYGANLTTLARPFRFGDMAAFDDPITLDNNLLSPPVVNIKFYECW